MWRDAIKNVFLCELQREKFVKCLTYFTWLIIFDNMIKYITNVFAFIIGYRETLSNENIKQNSFSFKIKVG